MPILYLNNDLSQLLLLGNFQTASLNSTAVVNHVSRENARFPILNKASSSCLSSVTQWAKWAYWFDLDQWFPKFLTTKGQKYNYIIYI